MIKVLIPTAFKKLTRGEGVAEVDADTVKKVLAALFLRYPGLGEMMTDRGGALQRHVNVFINGLDSRFIEGLDSPLADGDEVQLVVAIAGG